MLSVEMQPPVASTRRDHDAATLHKCDKMVMAKSLSISYWSKLLCFKNSEFPAGALGVEFRFLRNVNESEMVFMDEYG